MELKAKLAATLRRVDAWSDWVFGAPDEEDRGLFAEITEAAFLYLLMVLCLTGAFR